MPKSIPLSADWVEPQLASDLSFLSSGRRVWIMGVLNATPDSFYAGSRVSRVEEAVQLADRLIEEGADILDIGGESTRPGAADVTAQTELDRLLPLIEAIRAQWPQVPLSVDTRKAEVARHAMARGVDMVNDISALRDDPGMVEWVAEAGCPVVLMHMQGTPRTMQAEPHYEDVVDEIKRFFEERLAFATRHGLGENRVILDPGIGFGKSLEHNVSILQRLEEFLTFGRPLLVGVSRKSFIGRLLGSRENPLPPEARLEGSIAAALWAVAHGARGVRVHDVAPTQRALAVWEGLQGIS